MELSTNQGVDIFFRVLILLFSVVIHEVSHGAVAYALGDTTAKDAGRLTLNPLPHIDFLGSIVFPLFVGFGWAKPVPYNPYNLKNWRWGSLLVGAAGPLSNIFIAVFFGLILRFHNYLFSSFLDPTFFVIIEGIVILNLGLAIFNLIPMPPLDGSRVLFRLLPPSFFRVEVFLEHYGIIILFGVIMFFPSILSSLIFPLVSSLFTLITGGKFGF